MPVVEVKTKTKKRNKRELRALNGTGEKQKLERPEQCGKYEYMWRWEARDSWETFRKCLMDSGGWRCMSLEFLPQPLMLTLPSELCVWWRFRTCAAFKAKAFILNKGSFLPFPPHLLSLFSFLSLPYNSPWLLLAVLGSKTGPCEWAIF